jgi:hypothetical protein
MKSLFLSQEFTQRDKMPSITDLLSYTNGKFQDGGWEQPIDVEINASMISHDAGFQQQLGVANSRLHHLYSLGFTLCYGDMSDQIQSLGQLKNEALTVFDSIELLQITAYVSPPGSVGVLHFDRQHNFFLQKEGRKRWFVSEIPAIENPYENFVFPSATQAFVNELHSKGYKVAMPKDCGKNEYVLEPGDVLYVPPGFYHSPETGPTPSLHYTLTVEPKCFWKDLNASLFSVFLENCSDLNKDYRFLSAEDKTALLERCRVIIDEAELLPETAN